MAGEGNNYIEEEFVMDESLQQLSLILSSAIDKTGTSIYIDMFCDYYPWESDWKDIGSGLEVIGFTRGSLVSHIANTVSPNSSSRIIILFLGYVLGIQKSATFLISSSFKSANIEISLNVP